MDRFMITHSLLSSWQYAMKGNPYEDATTERDAYSEFLSTLRREPSETTEAMQNGIEFEDLVTYALSGPIDDDDPWYAGASQIASELKGATLQFKAKKTVEISGMQILLYGRLDALHAGAITDIKFSKKYERGKYFDSTQHPMYLELVPEADTFTYVISNGTQVWHETYRRDETRSILPIVATFLDWLRSVGLMDVYKEHWLAK